MRKKSKEQGPNKPPKRGRKNLACSIVTAAALSLTLQSCKSDADKILLLHKEIEVLDASEELQKRKIEDLTIKIDTLKDSIEAKQRRDENVVHDEYRARKLISMKEKMEENLNNTQEEKNNAQQELDRLEANNII